MFSLRSRCGPGGPQDEGSADGTIGPAPTRQVTAPGGASSEEESRRSLGSGRDEHGGHERRGRGEEVGWRRGVERMDRRRQCSRRAAGGAGAALAFRVMEEGVSAILALGRGGDRAGGRRRRFLRSVRDRMVAMVATHRVVVMGVSRPIRILVRVGRTVRQRAAMQHRRSSHRLQWQCRDENPHQGVAKPSRHCQSLRDRGKTLTTNGSLPGRFAGSRPGFLDAFLMRCRSLSTPI